MKTNHEMRLRWPLSPVPRSFVAFRCVLFLSFISFVISLFARRASHLSFFESLDVYVVLSAYFRSRRLDAISLLCHTPLSVSLFSSRLFSFSSVFPPP